MMVRFIAFDYDMQTRSRISKRIFVLQLTLEHNPKPKRLIYEILKQRNSLTSIPRTSFLLVSNKR
jgi:hypothetical protein